MMPNTAYYSCPSFSTPIPADKDSLHFVWDFVSYYSCPSFSTPIPADKDSLHFVWDFVSIIPAHHNSGAS
jgi:hypothetical protein